MQFFAIVAHIRFQDVIDILFLAVIAYHLYLWFQGTKALKALVGLLALGTVYTVAELWGLFLTTWMFQILWHLRKVNFRNFVQETGLWMYPHRRIR